MIRLLVVTTLILYDMVFHMHVTRAHTPTTGKNTNSIVRYASQSITQYIIRSLTHSLSPSFTHSTLIESQLTHPPTPPPSHNLLVHLSVYLIYNFEYAHSHFTQSRAYIKLKSATVVNSCFHLNELVSGSYLQPRQQR